MQSLRRTPASGCKANSIRSWQAGGIGTERQTTVVVASSRLVIIQSEHAQDDLSAYASPDRFIVEAIAITCLSHGIG